MRVKINEKVIELKKEITLRQLKEKYGSKADLVIYQGFPVDDLSIKLQDDDSIHFICRGKVPSETELESVMMSRHTPGVHQKLKKATVGIAGAGGLGSNIAVALSRIGVGTLKIADFDVVEPSNLNRQQYFIEQLGEPKVFALRDTLKKINPYQKMDVYHEKVTPVNLKSIFQGCDILIEAFDRADQKTMLIKEASELGFTLIAASGMAGYGANDEIITRKINDKFYLVGDFERESKPGQGLMAPRVMIAAAKQANLAVDILLNRS